MQTWRETHIERMRILHALHGAMHRLAMRDEFRGLDGWKGGVAIKKENARLNAVLARSAAKFHRPALFAAFSFWTRGTARAVFVSPRRSTFSVPAWLAPCLPCLRTPGVSRQALPNKHYFVSDAVLEGYDEALEGYDSPTLASLRAALQAGKDRPLRTPQSQLRARLAARAPSASRPPLSK